MGTEGELTTTLDALRAENLWQLTDTDLNTRLTELAVARHGLDVLIGWAAVEADRRGSFANLGYTSAAALMAHTSPLSGAQARQLARVGDWMSRLRDLDFGAVADAYEAGRLAGPHAELIARFLKSHCKRIPDHARGEVVDALLGAGAEPETHQLSNAITVLKEFLSTDDAPPAGEDQDLNSLHASPTLDGRVRVDADLSAHCGQLFLSALDALMTPQTGDEHSTDARTPEQLRHDAFEELLRRCVASGLLPTKAGLKPNVYLNIDAEELLHPDDDGVDDPFTTTPAADTSTATATGAVADTTGTGDTAESHTDRTHTHTDHDRGHRLGRAHSHGHGGCVGAPRTGRTRKAGSGGPHAVAAANGLIAVLARRNKRGWLSWVGGVSCNYARFLACDADIIPVLSKNGRPLDMGRSHRLVTRALREYLNLRDKGCSFPGCGRPVSWCDAHHIVWWSNGGTTTRANMTLLCTHHHILIHQGQWQIRMGPDETPLFIPPAIRDPWRRPIPANRRRTPATV